MDLSQRVRRFAAAPAGLAPVPPPAATDPSGRAPKEQTTLGGRR